MDANGGTGVETCARLVMGSSPLFIKGTWFPTHFLLSISDGLHCWSCHATEQAVAERAAGWDENVTDYLKRAQFYVSHQHPESTYTFLPDGENRKFSWTMEKNGTKLEAKWKCEKAKDDRQITSSILDFLMESNVKLSDEVLRKTQSFERMKGEAEKCLKQSEQLMKEKQQFEVDVFSKFVAVLNSKKSKLRELREKLGRFEPASGGSAEGHMDPEDTDGEEDSSSDDDENERQEKVNASERSSHGEYDKHASTSAAAETAFESKPSMHTTSAVKRSPRNQADVTTIQEPLSSSGAVDSAAALLADSTYTSAPKRRRRL